MADDTPNAVDIGKDGDVVLAVGDPVKVHLRVSAAVLSRGPEVIAAHFSSRYVPVLQAFRSIVVFPPLAAPFRSVG